MAFQDRIILVFHTGGSEILASVSSPSFWNSWWLVSCKKFYCKQPANPSGEFLLLTAY